MCRISQPTYFHIDPLLTIPFSALTGLVLGLASYYILVRHLLRGPMVAQMLGTFGLSVFLTYLDHGLFRPQLPERETGAPHRQSVMVGRSSCPIPVWAPGESA